MKKNFLILAGWFLLAAMAPGEKTNVIYILADDLGYAEVGYNGQKKIQTPELDRLAAGGMKFSAHYCGNAVCAPSRCSLMTGRHPGQAFVRANSPGFPNGQTPIPADSETLGKLMKRAGYTTSIIGKWGLGGVLEDGTQLSGHPNKQGFDHFFGYLDQRHAHNYYPEYLWRNGEKVPLNNGKELGDNDYSHDLMTKEALGWIEENAEKPFFLYLAYTIPHLAYQVPDLAQYADKKWPKKMKIHAAMTSRMDRDIGTIARLVESLGIAENTLIIFNSDNGAHGSAKSEQFFDTSGKLRGVKRDLYDGGVRSPMMAYWPGTIEAGSESDHISAFWDMLPTFAEMTGEEVKGATDGLSLLPTLRGEPERQEKHEYLYWELYERGRPNLAVRMDQWKAVIPNVRESREIQLYDVRTDVGERKNVAGEHPDVVKKIEGIMKSARVPSAIWDKSFGKRGFNLEAAKKAAGIEGDES